MCAEIKLSFLKVLIRINYPYQNSETIRNIYFMGVFVNNFDFNKENLLNVDFWHEF